MTDESVDNNSKGEQEGVFERLVSGPATARLLDFFVTKTLTIPRLILPS